MSQSVQRKIQAKMPEAVDACVPEQVDPAIEGLVREVIGRVTDKWTMLVLEILTEHGELRFTRVGELVGDISQKMLTKTLRQMERDGLVKRTVHPVIPPRVEYRLTEMGGSLSEAFCGVWMWVERHYEAVQRARGEFDGRAAAGGDTGGGKKHLS